MKKLTETDAYITIRFSNREQRFLRYILVVFREFYSSYILREERAFATALFNCMNKKPKPIKKKKRKLIR